MKNIYLLTFLLCFLAACSHSVIPKSQQDEAVGIFKTHLSKAQNWDHVATIHGWYQDLEACYEIVEFLNKKEPDQYVCVKMKDWPLN